MYMYLCYSLISHFLLVMVVISVCTYATMNVKLSPWLSLCLLLTITMVAKWFLVKCFVTKVVLIWMLGLNNGMKH